MKTNTLNQKRKAGMTLLELTVVILVLLSLISILFVGARAWKKGSDRSANILNIRNTQQAMRGEENMKTLAVGADFTVAQLQQYMKMPTAPVAAVTYAPTLVITPQSAATATDILHLWLGPGGTGVPTAEYGHNTMAEISGW
jgi:type II secretory pathway pseudopilin PulG